MPGKKWGHDPFLFLSLYTGNWNGIQNISYVYDKNGNITQIEDISETHAAKTVDYAYDSLNRLTRASTTITSASTTPYRYSYTYDALGNMLSRTENGSTTTYTYATNTPAYLNPHAVATTTAGSALAYTYDNNGNLLTTRVGTSTPTSSYTWDYNNRLTQAVTTTGGNATSTFAYDASGQRVKMTVATTSSVTTYYPTKEYNITGSVPTKHISLPDGTMVATIVGTGTSTTVSYIHTDHLGGMNVATDDSGAIVSLEDIYPYGNTRIDEQSGLNEQRKGISGHEYDPTSGLTYANSRYYNAANAKFISQDPIFLLVGANNFSSKWKNNWRDVESGQSSNSNGSPGEEKWAMQEYLSNPQHLNSYSYVLNNPLKYTDPTGEWEVHFSPVIPSVNFGLGGEVGNSWTFGFASDGTFGLSSSVHGGGLAGVDASINWTAGYSNADTWSETLGTGEYVQAGGKVIAGGGITTNYADGKYTGTDISVGLGARGLPEVPVAFSGGINKTTPVFQGSVKPVVDGIKSGYNAVKSTATNTYNAVKSTVSSGANAVKQGASSVFNFVKSKF